MATTYSCIINNEWGDGNTAPSSFLSGNLIASGDQLRFQTAYRTYTLLRLSDTTTFLENLGFDRPTNILIRIPTTTVGTTAVFENGTTISSDFIIRLNNVDSPIVDYYYNWPTRITLEFTAFIDGETVPTSGLMHNIDFNFASQDDYRLRTIQEIIAVINTAGFNLSSPELSQPNIFCEQDGDPTSTTTTTVTGSPTMDLVVNVTNEILRSVEIEAQILEAFYQAQLDEAAGNLNVTETNTSLMDLYQQLATTE